MGAKPDRLPPPLNPSLTADLLSEVAGFVDVSVSFLLQLVDNFPLFLRLFLVILDLLFQVALGLFVQLYQVDLLLRLSGRFQHVLHAHAEKKLTTSFHRSGFQQFSFTGKRWRNNTVKHTKTKRKLKKRK